MHMSDGDDISLLSCRRKSLHRHKSNGETHRTEFYVAQHMERLPHLGAGLLCLPALQSLPPPSGRFHAAACSFLHVHIDLVGPLPISAGYTYCLTAVGRFTRWPDAITILNITADTVAHALLTDWISLFCCPQKITTDQRRPF
jgi:hypothetical protein